MQARVCLGFARRRGSPRLDEHLESSACGEGGRVSAKVSSKLKSLYLGGSWSRQGSEVWPGISLQPGARRWVSGPSAHICSLALRGGPRVWPTPALSVQKGCVVFSWSWANTSSFPWLGKTRSWRLCSQSGGVLYSCKELGQMGGPRTGLPATAGE